MTEEKTTWLNFGKCANGYLVADEKNQRLSNHNAFTTLDEALSFVREFFGVEEQQIARDTADLCGVRHPLLATNPCHLSCRHEHGNHRAYMQDGLRIVEWGDEEPELPCRDHFVLEGFPYDCAGDEGHVGKHTHDLSKLGGTIEW